MRKILDIPDRFCLNCDKKLPRLAPSQIKQGRGKFCSNKCSNTGEHNHKWKNLKVKSTGDTAYNSLHKWVQRNKTKPNRCESCGQSGYLHWANKSGKYERNLDDFIALCVSCHTKFDVLHNDKVIRNQFGDYKLKSTP